MIRSRLYLWQNENWPEFRWDAEKLLSPIYEVSQEVSLLLGRISMFGEGIKTELLTSTLENEIISSNSVENILLKREAVRSSILAQLNMDTEGLSVNDHYSEGTVRILLDAVTNSAVPLTKERLWGWHSDLFPSGISDGRRIITGQWRQGPMYVISGNTGKEIIHFEAPPAEMVDGEIDSFLKFVNENDVNPIIKAAVSHLWFVTIHPFADGNGRIARTITEMLLARADNSPHRYYSFSSAIMKNRKAYYDALEYAEKSTMDVTAFIAYFIETMRVAVADAELRISKTIEKPRFWDRIRSISMNERQVKMVNKLVDGFEGRLTAEKWSKITKCSHATALRDINDLIQKGVLEEDGGKSRNAGYILKKNVETVFGSIS